MSIFIGIKHLSEYIVVFKGIRYRRKRSGFCVALVVVLKAEQWDSMSSLLQELSDQLYFFIISYVQMVTFTLQ